MSVKSNIHIRDDGEIAVEMRVTDMCLLIEHGGSSPGFEDGESSDEALLKHEEIGQLRRRVTHAESHLDAARGAVCLLAEVCGIESGEHSNVAKLAKSCRAVVQAAKELPPAIDKELANLRGAMRRMGLEIPDAKPGEWPTGAIARMAHEVDLAVRGGEVLISSSVPKDRDGLMGELAALSSCTSRCMIEIAKIDGYVSKDMGEQEAFDAVRRWAIDSDNGELVTGGDEDGEGA
jgi:hypothetical protein